MKPHFIVIARAGRRPRGRCSGGSLFSAVGAAFGLGSAVRFPAMCACYGGAFLAAYAVVLAVFAYPALRAEFALGLKHRGPFPLKGICPFGGFVGILSAANCFIMCVVDISVIAALSADGCSFYAEVNYGGSAAYMPALMPVWGSIAAIALAVFAPLSPRARSRAARAAVLFQFACLAVLALCGAGKGGLRFAAGVEFSALLSPRIWLAALGQALLSLSLAAGVMPSFAREIPSLRPSRAAGVVIGANFAGSLLSCAAVFSLAGEAASAAGIDAAFQVYRFALSAAFPCAVVCGIFGSVFYLSLIFTSFISCSALARPPLALLQQKLSPKGASAVFFAFALVAALPFCAGVSPAPLDFFGCELLAPLCALAHAACFAFAVLTERSRRGII